MARAAELSCLLFCTLLLLTSASASENSPPTGSVQPSPSLSFEELYTRAAVSYEAHRYAEAVEDLLAAYKLKAEPLVLYNVAQSYRKLGDISKAQLFFHRYLEADKNIPADKQEQIRHYLDELHKQEQATREHSAVLQPRMVAPASAESQPIGQDPGRTHSPRWLKASIGLMFASGGALTVTGATFLGLDGRCSEEPTPPALACGLLYQTLVPGAVTTAVGAGLLIGGALSLTIPYLKARSSQRMATNPKPASR